MATIPLFYVYVLARPNGKVFYVGKGSKARVFHHEQEAKRGCNCHKCHVIRKIWRSGGEVQRYTMLTTNDEEEAFAYERELIGQHGRANLCNQTDGGDGASNPSEAAREKIGAALRGRISSRRGIPRSEETRRRMSIGRSGKRNPQDAIERMREKLIGRKMRLSAEERQARADRIRQVGKPFESGVPAWNKGMPRSTETRKKLSEASALASGLEYHITDPEGGAYTTRHLKAFCVEHGLNYDSIFYYLKHNLLYKGWRIVRSALHPPG